METEKLNFEISRLNTQVFISRIPRYISLQFNQALKYFLTVHFIICR